MADNKLPQEIQAYAHDGAKLPNNPPVGLASARTDPEMPAQQFGHDPHVDPFLSWANEVERASFDVPTVSLHVHESIDLRTIIEQVQKPASIQHSLFEQFENPRPFREAIDFYKHRDGWTNRMIVGDSLLVMNSLLQKESVAGKVQMIYMDPPYGNKCGSNSQIHPVYRILVALDSCIESVHRVGYRWVIRNDNTITAGELTNILCSHICNLLCRCILREFFNSTT